MAIIANWKMVAKLADTLCFLFAHNSIRMRSHTLASDGHTNSYDLRYTEVQVAKEVLYVAFKKPRKYIFFKKYIKS